MTKSATSHLRSLLILSTGQANDDDDGAAHVNGDIDENEQQWNAIITALSSLLQLPNYDDKVTMPIIKLLMANSTTPM